MSYTPESERFNDEFFDLIRLFDSISEIAKNRIRSEEWTKEHKSNCVLLRKKLDELETWLREADFL